MDPKTEEALDASIKHWKDICHAAPTGEVSIRSSACALCQLFISATGNCGGCPVVRATGVDGCRDTPYINANIAWKNWQSRLYDYEHAELAASPQPFALLKRRLEEAHFESIAVAKEELAFLRSLKPSKSEIIGTGVLRVDQTCPHSGRITVTEFNYRRVE